MGGGGGGEGGKGREDLIRKKSPRLNLTLG